MLKEYSKDSILFFIGNKSDLEKEREVKIEDAMTFKNNFDDILKYFLKLQPYMVKIRISFLKILQFQYMKKIKILKMKIIIL